MGCQTEPASSARSGRRRRGALAALLQSHRATIVQFLYRMVQDRNLAEELAVQVFLQIYRSQGEEIEPGLQPPVRLFRIATDLALEGMPQPTNLQPADVMEGAGPVVASMPAMQRAAVLMHKFHCMNACQIAAVLRCSEPAAMSLLLSAYDRLRAELIGREVPVTLDCAAL